LTPDPNDAINGPEAEERSNAPVVSGPPFAPAEPPQDDRGEAESAGAYSRAKRILFVVELAAGLAFLVLLLQSGASVSVARWLESFTVNPWLLTLLYMTAIGLAYEPIGLPLDFYGGYILEHRFGQSTQSFWAWAWDAIKGKLVGFVIGAILLEAVYWLLRSYPERWWIIAAFMFVAFAVVMARLAPVLLMPIFYKFTPLKDEELGKRLVRLCEKAGTSVRGVFEMDMSRKTRAANAALAGLGATRRIVLGDTLLEGFDADEVEAVLAHELGHHANRDIWKGLAFQSVISTLGFYTAYRALAYFSGALGLRGPADIASLPLLMLTMAGVSLLFMPTANAFSRRLERRADRFALELTGNPAAFVSTMARLGRLNLAEFEPNPIIEFLLYSHPSIGGRIRMAREMFPTELAEEESS
jgi:STE24 endopeptidase